MDVRERDGSGSTGSTVGRSSRSTTGCKSYERAWNERFDALDAVLEELKEKEGEGDGTMTSSGTAVVTLPTDTEILITREFDAPRHLVYRAWTTPELIERWWSGKRGEVTSVEVDLRVGGHVALRDDANEGFEVAFHGEYREIVPERAHRHDRGLRGRCPVRTPSDAGIVNTSRSPRPTAARPDAWSRSATQGGPRHDHRVRHGGRDAGGDGRLEQVAISLA